MALSIPLTLLMTFGMMAMLGMDLQQISIATLIIALGLLVDDPVAAGSSRSVAAWLGPTKLATAILYATISNIVAYLFRAHTFFARIPNGKLSSGRTPAGARALSDCRFRSRHTDYSRRSVRLISSARIRATTGICLSPSRKRWCSILPADRG